MMAMSSLWTACYGGQVLPVRPEVYFPLLYLAITHNEKGRFSIFLVRLYLCTVKKKNPF